MMAFYLNVPPALPKGKNSQDSLEKLRNYVFRTVETLNAGMKDFGAEGVLDEINRAISGGEGETDNSVLSAHNNIRSLIIKTADFAVSNSEEFKKILKSEYSASSDYGELIENLENEITVNSEGINQLFRYTSGIRSEFGDFSTTSEQYIKTGLLYYDDAGAPVFGVGVGNLSTKIEANGETALDRQNLLTTTTADELAFWNAGQKVAYISSNKMYFPSGSLVAYEADISGKINATSGTIGGCEIQNGVLKVTNANIESIDAGKITTGFISVRNMKFDGVMQILGRDSTSEEYTQKGVFGYETESFESSYKGLLLESQGADQSLFLYDGNTWLLDQSGTRTRLLRFNNRSVEMIYDEDYDYQDSGFCSEITLGAGYVEFNCEDRDSGDYARMEVDYDDIYFRIYTNGSSRRCYLSEIMDACGL